LYCDADVAAMELCNVIMKWIEKRSNDARDKSASGVIWASNNANDININNETIKICSSCKQFSTVQYRPIQIREHCYIYDEQSQLNFPR